MEDFLQEKRLRHILEEGKGTHPCQVSESCKDFIVCMLGHIRCWPRAIPNVSHA